MGSSPTAAIYFSLKEFEMNEHSDPIEFLIEFAWANGADRFVVNNAKDELNKLKQDNDHLQKILTNPVAYGLINDRHDLYCIRLMDNPYNTNEAVVPLYSNRQEFLTGDWKGYNHYGKFTK